MTRKIIPIQSVAVTAASSINLPADSRIHSVKGEADGKPTYDFVVSRAVWDRLAGAAGFTQIKYCGTRNGVPVNLMKDWPDHVTSVLPPAAVGDLAIQVTAGTGVALQVYFISGSVTV